MKVTNSALEKLLNDWQGVVSCGCVGCALQPRHRMAETENRLVGKYTIVPRNRWSGRKEFQKVSSLGARLSDHSGGKLNHRMRGQAGRHAPRRHVAPHLSDAVSSVKEDKVDRELHSDGMHGLTGEYPQTFTRTQAFAPQQAFGALCAMIGNFHAAGQLGMARSVQNLKANLRAGLRAPCAPSVQRHGKPGRQLHLVPVAPLKMLRQPGIIRCDRSDGAQPHKEAVNERYDASPG